MADPTAVEKATSTHIWNAWIHHQLVELQDLRQADLRDMDLTGYWFVSADMTEADLRNAKLNNANLSYTTLSKAKLQGADLTGADLRHTALAGATYDNNTKWPVGFDTEFSGYRLTNVDDVSD